MNVPPLERWRGLFRLSDHARAIVQALFVTFLWSTSWVIIKLGLRESIPALTFAGMRYTLAALCLLPFALRRSSTPMRSLNRRDLLLLGTLGLLYYAVTQGAQFLSLSYLPSATVSLLLSFSAIVVVGLGIRLLNETPTRSQWFGLALYFAGVIAYFVPLQFSSGELLGVVIAIAGLLANAMSSVIGRSINREGKLSPLLITLISMSIGGVLLLVVGLITQGVPPLSLTTLLLVAWLAVVNTALAFTLWNKTLQTLSAFESSIINNAMMVQIPILAWLFLGEGISLKNALAFSVAGCGILIVQLRRG
ncbi:MAG: DMT family transporter [Anaerolinea sp.]|nr:DMT family transporter [Anaerolinea sp.]